MLATNFDKPVEMVKNKTTGEFEVWCMVRGRSGAQRTCPHTGPWQTPPGRVVYAFKLDDEDGLSVAADQPKKISPHETIKDHEDLCNFIDTKPLGTDKGETDPDGHFSFRGYQREVHRKFKQYVRQPRTVRTQKRVAAVEARKAPFGDAVKEKEVEVGRWVADLLSRTKIEHVCRTKENVAAVVQVLTDCQPLLVNVFACYACYSGSDMHAVNLHTFRDLALFANVVDGTTVRRKDVELVFISCVQPAPRLRGRG